MNLNRVTLAGNLTRDPELKKTQGGSSVCVFSIAVNERWRDDRGEKRERVDFIDCEAWGKVGEVIARYIEKGDPIYVEGKMRRETWEKDGEKKSRVKVLVLSMQFVGGGRRESGGGGGGGKASATVDREGTSEVMEAEDIPF